MPPPPFETIMPEIETRSRRHYSRLHGAAQDDAVQESVCQAFALYDSAVRRGNFRFTPCSLAWYANRAVDEGRKFTGGTIKKDALDRGRAVGIDALNADGQNIFAEALIQRQTSPLDAARIAIDWPAFTSTLDERSRRMVTELAVGSTKTEIAREAGLSNGRVSQIFGDVAEQYEDYLGTPGFEVRARRNGKRKSGRPPKVTAA
jgi:DNA-directed RNA polymerase specialized sigma24 family protein